MPKECAGRTMHQACVGCQAMYLSEGIIVVVDRQVLSGITDRKVDKRSSEPVFLVEAPSENISVAVPTAYAAMKKIADCMHKGGRTGHKSGAIFFLA